MIFKDIKKRFWEIDTLRGLAIIAMIIFHIGFDIYFISTLAINVPTILLVLWIILGIIIFSSFFLLVGISLTLSYCRTIALSKSESGHFKKFLKRGLMVFLWGLVITIITWLVIPEAYVIFGTLHFIGLSIILSYPFLKLKRLNLFLSIPIIIIGLFFFTFTVSFHWLVWLGLRPHYFFSVDYFPLFPYFGIILLGIFIGNTFYKNYKRTFHLKDRSESSSIQTLMFLGRHSLLIYLIHQPVVLLVLLLLGLIDFDFINSIR